MRWSFRSPRDDQVRPNTPRQRPFGPLHQDVSPVLPSHRCQRPTIVTIWARRRATASISLALQVSECPPLARTTSTEVSARNTGAEAIEVYDHSASNPRTNAVAQTVATCGEPWVLQCMVSLMPAINLGEFGTNESVYSLMTRIFTEFGVTRASHP